MDTADPADAAEAIAGLPWWHRIEVAPGVTTPGAWDLAPMAARLPWPAARLDGLRCLDVGTMDGFWAFEMERRGAADVVAVDLLDARREGFEWFVFNRRGLAKVVALAGFDVRATTGILRDRYVLPPGQRASLRTRSLHRLPLRGRSAAVRARPVTGREGGEDQDQEGQGRDGQGQDGQGDGRK